MTSRMRSTQTVELRAQRSPRREHQHNHKRLRPACGRGRDKLEPASHWYELVVASTDAFNGRRGTQFEDSILLLVPY